MEDKEPNLGSFLLCKRGDFQGVIAGRSEKRKEPTPFEVDPFDILRVVTGTNPLTPSVGAFDTGATCGTWRRKLVQLLFQFFDFIY